MATTLVVTLMFRIIVAIKVFDEIYLLTGGGTLTRVHDVAANSRVTINVAQETFDATPADPPGTPPEALPPEGERRAWGKGPQAFTLLDRPITTPSTSSRDPDAPPPCRTLQRSSFPIA